MTAADGSRVRTVFIGTGPFAVPALQALAAAPEVSLVGVVTAPPRPAGRRAELRPSPVASAVESLALGPALTPERLRRPEAVASVLALRPALVVLADYGQIVPKALLDVSLGALNLHPSLLPRHRGASPIPATILAGDEVTGVTLMRMDEGLDTGPIVAADEVPLNGDEIAPDLEAMQAERAAVLLRRSLGPWIAGVLEPRSQPSAGATLTRPLRRGDGRLDPAKPAIQLERQVRAFAPWPGSWLETDEGRLMVWTAAAVGDRGIAPGALGDRDGGLVLGTGDGTLLIVEVQAAGSRRMTAEAFLRGRRGFSAAVLPAPAAEPIERPVG